MFLWLLLVLSVLIIYIKLIKSLDYWKDRNIPYLKPWPIFGNMAIPFFRQKSIIDISQDMYHVSNSRYVGSFFFTKPVLTIRDLDLIKQIAIKDFDHFVDHRPFIPEDSDPLFGNNLFSLTGQRWRHMRATLSPAFTGSKMRLMFTLMCECAQQFTNNLIQTIKPNEIFTTDMKTILTRFTNDVIASTAFGIKCDSMAEKDNSFYEQGQKISTPNALIMIKFMGYGVCGSLMKFFKIRLFSDEMGNFFRDIVLNNMEMREKENIVRPDMIHLLMEARKGQLKHEDKNIKNEEEGSGFATVEESQIGKNYNLQKRSELSDNDIVAQALLFFIAGFESISVVLCHMAYELALNPDIQQNLQNEIDETLSECNGKITYELIVKMKYLDMVLSETLRKWPPAPTTDRVCVDSYTIPAKLPGEVSVDLKKGDVVFFPIYGIHHDPKYYPNPERFDPERFGDENKGNINPLAYIPFGVGPRNCIGSRFALLEAKTIFVYLLNKFSLVIVEKSQVPLKTTTTQFSMNAENGFWLGIKRRIN